MLDPDFLSLEIDYYNRLNKRIRRYETYFSDEKSEEIFKETVLDLNETLGTDFAFIGEIISGSKCETKYLSEKNLIIENFEYELRDTPCKDVAQGDACVYDYDVQSLFPKDLLLQQMGINAYAGAPLNVGSGGDVNYILVVLSRKPISSKPFFENILNTTASKLFVEIERLRLIKRFREKEKYLRTLTSLSNEGILILQNNKIVEANKASLEILKYTETELKKLDSIENLIVDKDLEYFQYNLNLLTEESVELRFRSKTGESLDIALSFKNIVYENEEAKVLVFRNETEKNKLLRKISLKNTSWELLNNELTKQVNKYEKVNAKLTEANEKISALNKSLKINQERFLNLFDSANDAIVVFEYDLGLVVRINRMAEVLFDLSFDKVRKFQNGLFDTADPSLSNLSELLSFLNYEKGKLYKYSTVVKGKKLDLEVSSQIIEVGGVRYLQSIIRDISNRVLQEKKIAEVNEKLNWSLQISKRAEEEGKLGLFEYNYNDKRVRFSDNLKLLLALDDEKLNQISDLVSFLNYLDKNKAGLAENTLREVLIHNEFLTKLRYVRDNDVMDLEIKGRVIKNNKGLPEKFLITIQDISNRVKQEYKFSLIYENLLDVYFELDENLIVQEISPSVKAGLGFFPEEIKGRTLTQVFYRYEDLEQLKQDLLKNGYVQNYSIQIVDRSNHVKWVEVNARVLYDEKRELKNIVGIARDVTDRVKREREINEKQRLNNALVETMVDGLLIYNKDYKVISCNRKAVEIFGQSEKALRSKKFSDLKLKLIHLNGEDLPWESIPIVRSLEKDETVNNFILGVSQKRNKNRWLSINSKSITLSNSKGEVEKHALVSISEITDSIDRKRSEKMVSVSFNSLRDGIIIQDRLTTQLTVNPAAGHILGVDYKTLKSNKRLREHWDMIKISNVVPIELKQPFFYTLNSGKILQNEVLAIKVDNTEFKWVSLSSYPFYHNESQDTASPDGVVCLISDITEEHIAIERQKFLSHIHERLIFVNDLMANINYLLKFISRYTGADYVEFYEQKNKTATCKNAYVFLPEYSEVEKLRINKKIEIENSPLKGLFKSFSVILESVKITSLIPDYNKKKLPAKLNLFSIPVGVKSDVIGRVVLYNPKRGVELKEDIAMFKNIGTVLFQYIARYQANEKLKNSLKEKEFLYKEVHHRVKNNLQLIISTLYLRKYNQEDEKFQKKIEDIITSVKSIAIIHEQLMSSTQVNQIEISNYLHKLVNEIPMTLGITDEKIELDVDVVKKVVSMDFAVNFGLLVNELMANALKHAFISGIGNKISLKLVKLQGDFYNFTFEDNGVGMEDRFLQLQSPESLGLSLINTFSAQLKADVKIENKKGTKYTFIFKFV